MIEIFSLLFLGNFHSFIRPCNSRSFFFTLRRGFSLCTTFFSFFFRITKRASEMEKERFCSRKGEKPRAPVIVPAEVFSHGPQAGEVKSNIHFFMKRRQRPFHPWGPIAEGERKKINDYDWFLRNFLLFVRRRSWEFSCDCHRDDPQALAWHGHSS